MNDAYLRHHSSFFIDHASRSALIRSRPIHARHGDVEQAQVHAQLCAVVYDVAEYKFPQNFVFGAREENHFTVAHGPIAVQNFIARGRNHRFCIGKLLVASGEQALDSRDGLGAIHRLCKVQLVMLQGVRRPDGQIGDVCGE